MLAETFSEVVATRQQQAQVDQAAREARDDFIKLNFEQLNTAFSQMIDTVTGAHPLLTVAKSALTETVSNRHFTSLDKTVIEVRSTLYGKLETIRFSPALRFVEKDQFGLIEIETIDTPLPPAGNGTAASFHDILRSGILMRGAESASLVVARPAGESGFDDLSEQNLEQFLRTAFIREG